MKRAGSGPGGRAWAPSLAARWFAPCAPLALSLAALIVPVGEGRCAPAAQQATHQATAGSAGEALYQQGILSSGEPLEAMHDGGVHLQGAAAACMNCHRRSGLGSKEGNSSIPPITWRYLVEPRAQNPEEVDLPYVPGMRAEREPYTDATIARAIREGIDSEGKPLSSLMPQYALNDTDMQALIGYLKHLDRRRPPGITDTVLHFATIITPDADPVKRAGMLDVLTHYFADKNVFPLGAVPPLRSSRKMMFMVNRRWELHVWELKGPPDTWREQLTRFLAQQPVFAVVSGIGGKNWAPVHDFCEQEALPCLFPNVEVPVEADHDFYSVYFSKGVLLESGLIAARIVEEAGAKEAGAPTHVWQVYRAGDNGERGAQALATALKAHGIAVSEHALAPGESVAHAMQGIPRPDVLVLWLRPPDVAALARIPPATHTVFMSGLMGGLDSIPLPANWRDVTRLAYPFDLPEGRRVRVDYAFGWFSIRQIPMVAPQVQADTYLACGLLAETLSHMVDAFVRDYLVERIQDMLERRILTGYYPRLTLAPGQTFASKGGYIVRFAGPDHIKLVADGDWIVP
ncbi:c-type cytochrome [Paraburkholderia silvatlantica]|uniref:Cytochrome c n=1 Tax=Paraburkholderia silvatlantica TaxID=321895 RepID=A0A2U1ABB0_9BURK|nr:c-type cytochrome [Paraburkholderia silvatlantica]MBB2930215.1 cytochrome c553 [Paraburkholderia silvatlantica]PVY32044.1 cytochrome c [Paraburkholderia silvatlantica]PXW37664.1 cytochrome c [Paraburkholderia silvatlantica]PYE18354.1 cytochrome c [Paraburkholderia silvatlantica]TDQ97872.1 cytochrome c [Paraburkholderia silvatlantica]